ncbi:hypothetical protein Tco_0866485, partial [Tanacetum coccineum]
MRKLKMPVFDGEDAYGWIYRVERYFEIQGIPPQEQLRVVVDGTTREYVVLFEKLACQLVGVSPSVMEATFIKGLKTDLRAAIRVMRPEGLAHAMYPVSTSTIRSETNIQARQFKQLTKTELADKQSKGLCFKCDEKFTIGHRYPSKTLHVLLVMDEEDEDDEDDEENVENKEGSHIHLDSVEVSLNSLLGFTSLRTMKIRRILGGVVVTVLIDNGVTHNFLSKVLVARNNSVGVMLGNRGFEESVGLCKGVVLSLSGLQIIEDFFPFELELTMSFNMDGDRILIKEDPSLNRKQAAINDLLKEFEDIFQLPEGLPPIRAQDYAINLCEGKGPISVRPYRYPHAQKGEIEKLVAEMLHAGIIQPS